MTKPHVALYDQLIFSHVYSVFLCSDFQRSLGQQTSRCKRGGFPSCSRSGGCKCSILEISIYYCTFVVFVDLVMLPWLPLLYSFLLIFLNINLVEVFSTPFSCCFHFIANYNLLDIIPGLFQL